MSSETFTLGVEEEFQLIHPQTGELCSNIDALLEKGQSLLGGKLRAELFQSAVEVVSGICPSVAAVREELYEQRTLLAKLTHQEGITILSAGTHPISFWADQDITNQPRYFQLVEEQQDVVRSQVIFGLHVHVGIKERELAVRLMNQVRTWLPHLLALSTNSPFWQGRFTGIKSYRSVLWQGGPRSGIPDVIGSRADFNHYMQDLTAVEYINSGKDIWWDVRINTNFDTIEFRIFDMPATIEDAIALTALCQALIAKLTWLDTHHIETPVISRSYIEENKWQAAHYGLDAKIADFTNLRRLDMRDALHELLDFVKDVVVDLGSQHEIDYLRALLSAPKGTGADQQIAVYTQTGSLQAVVQHLLQQTFQGIHSTESE